MTSKALAIYHFSVTVLSRARGHRIVASAAAHAAARLRDDYYGIVHNHARRPGVEFTEILAPDDAPRWVYEREQLWNHVEAAEHRKDSQLARVIDISLPKELSFDQRVDLLRDFIRSKFVMLGMIADIAIRRTKLDNPSAHALLTLRAATLTGFGPKMRQWNAKGNLLDWRASWANRANIHLARAGHELRIDHRTLDDQHIELTPARKIGVGRPLPNVEGLPAHLKARFTEQRQISRANGAAIIEDPVIAIRALAHQRRYFSAEQLSQFLRSRTDGDAQHDAALSTVMASSELVTLTPIDSHPTLYTSRDLIDAGKSLKRRAILLAARRSADAAQAAPDSLRLPPARSTLAREVLTYVVGAGDFKAVALLRPDQVELLHAARAHWQARSRRVLDRLPQAEDAPLGQDHVLIVSDAEMIDVKSLEKILAAVERARAKLILVADSAQLRAMGDKAPILDLIGWGPDSRA